MTRQQEQTKYEEEIMSRFCSAMDPQLKIVAKRESPDFELEQTTQSVPPQSRRIGVELTAYRQQGAHNSLQNANDAFAKHVHDEWVLDPRVCDVALRLDYSSVSEKLQIPKPNQRDQIVVELKSLVLEKAIEHKTDTTACFVEGLENDILLPGMPSHALVRSARFPELAKHFKSIGMTRYEGVCIGWPQTSLSSIWLGIDQTELRRLVQNKSKKLGAYRQGLPHRQWLVLHSDGIPVSASLAEMHLIEALAIVRKELESAPNQFDEAWWFQDALMNSRTVHRI